MTSTTLYGSNVANGTLASACTMASATGGAETSVTTSYGTAGTDAVYGEITSKGLSVSQVTALPATPTGNGWVFAPGATTLSGVAYTGKITLATAGTSSGATVILRFWKYASGIYSSIGSITTGIPSRSKTLWTFTQTSMPDTSFGAGDLLYVEMYLHDPDDLNGSTVTVYESNSATQGVTHDMQITIAPPRIVPLLPGQNITNGISNYVCGGVGEVFTAFRPSTNFVDTPGVQALVQAANFTIVRCFPIATDTDATLDQYAAATANAGCVMMTVLDSPWDDARCQHVVTYLGSRCNLYEFGNEPALYSSPTVSAAQYNTYWNTTIPHLRAINPRAAFIGNANNDYYDGNGYTTSWLNACVDSGVYPDGVSFHLYPCGGLTQGQCSTLNTFDGGVFDFATVCNWQSNLANTILGPGQRMCLTEWNFDSGFPPASYGDDASFMVPWTTSAFNSILSASPALAMACVFNLCSGAGQGHLDLISATTGLPRTNGQYDTLKSLFTALPHIQRSGDNFTRPDQAGLGTASDGEAWAIATGPSTFAIVSNTAHITGNAASLNVALLGSSTRGNATGTLRFQHTAGVNDKTGLVLRSSADGTTSGYYCVLSDSAITFYRTVSGVATSIATTNFVPTAGTNWYQMRFTIASPFADGTNPMLLAKFWLDSIAEPPYWILIFTDTSGAQISAAGQFGIYAQGNNNAATITISNFSAGPLPTRAPTAYGSGADSFGVTGNPGLTMSSQSVGNAMIDSGCNVARYVIEWNSIELAVQSTSNTAINAAGSVTITLAAFPSNFIVGALVAIDADSGQAENVTLTAVNAGAKTITFVAANTHTTTPYPVAIVPNAGDTPASSGSPNRVQTSYNWTLVDDYVAFCLADGFLPMFTLAAAPTWHSVGLACSSTNPVSLAADVPTFVNALLQRYPANTFYAFEAANEGFSYCSSAGMFSTQLLPLIQNLRTAINAYSPKTLLGGPAVLLNNKAAIQAWWSGFYGGSPSCASYVDFLNFHYYPSDGTLGPDSAGGGEDTFIANCADIYAACVAAKDFGKPIWLTEFGWGAIPDATIAVYVSQLLNEARRQPGIARILIFSLGGMTPGNGVNQMFNGTSYLVWKNFIAQHPLLTSSSGSVGNHHGGVRVH